MPGISKEQIAQAYPTFYGEIVASRDLPPREGSNKNRTVVYFKPYGNADGSEVHTNNDGVIVDTFWWNDDDIVKEYTGIHKLMMGLRNKTNPTGDTGKAAEQSYSGWFRKSPGNFAQVLPVTKPKDAVEPGRPAEWDREAFLRDFNERLEGEADASSTEARLSRMPAYLDDILVNVAVGKKRSAAVRAIMESPEIKGAGVFEVGSITDTLSALVDSGRLVVDDNGAYQTGEASVI